MDRDLKAAGIAKKDERGRTLDVHALRTTFATMLSMGGVAPRTAQAALRHSNINLTMNTYTDPKLLDVMGAMNALPALPRMGEFPGVQEIVKVMATGTDGKAKSLLAPTLAPTTGFLTNMESLAGHKAEFGKNESRSEMREFPKKNADSRGIRVKNLERETGLEPATFTLAT